MPKSTNESKAQHGDSGNTPIAANRLAIALATYNEIENLPDLTEQLWQTVPSAKVLVVDDNSPDGTGDWCDEQIAQGKPLSCLHRPQKMGLGSATIAAFQWACEHDYELLLTLDADFSHPVRFVPDLLRAMEDSVDVVVGSRYISGGRTKNWPLTRRIGSRLVNGMARRLYHLQTHDCSGAFRVYRIEQLREIDWSPLANSGYAFYEASLWLLESAGATVVEVPIEFVQRTRGESKIGVREAVRAVSQMMHLRASCRQITKG